MNVNRKFSLSSDSDSKQLTKEQNEYFKDSKMRDDNGIKYVEYENGNEQARTDALNSLEDAKFSLSQQGEQFAPIGNFNVYGKDVMLEQDVAPIGASVSNIEQEERGASYATTDKEYVGMDDFLNRDSSVWRNVDYNDDATKASIMKNTHEDMVKDGAIVVVADDVINSVKQSYPDLRGVKKNERTLRLREAMKTLKSNIRQFLSGLKDQSFDFEVNGKVLEARLYNTGINEVLEKVTQEKANMLYTSEEIFKNARYLYSTPDYGGDPNVYRWNYFYTPVQIGQETVGVRIAVRDLALQGESQIYNWGIKKDASLGGEGGDSVNRRSRGASSDASNYSITDFAPFVKPDEDTVSDDFAPTAEDIAEFFPSVPTIDDLKREAEGLIAEAVKNSEDADTVNRLYEQYKELQKKIRREEAEEAAWNKEQLASLTEADAPIEQPHAQYGNELKDTTPLDQKSLEAYARDIAETLNFDLKKKALKETLYRVMQDYSTGKISSFSNLYSEVIRNFGDNGIKTLDENLQDAKNHIRNTKIYASPIVKSDFGSPKEWNNFRLRNSGRLYFSKDRSALGVDSLYSELSEIYPYLFPDSIWNVGDQIRRIAEVASMDHIIQEPLPDEQLQEATTLIHDAVTEYHETERMILADEITKLPIDESLAPPAPIEEKAGGTVSNTKPITENDTSISEDEQPTKLTRKSLHQGIVDTVKNKFTANGFDFDKVLKNAKCLSTFATVDNIPQRVMEKALGYKEGQILADVVNGDETATASFKSANRYTVNKNADESETERESAPFKSANRYTVNKNAGRACSAIF